MTWTHCDVVHGQFAFHGTVDSTKIGQIFMDDINLQFPVVIEKGDITVKLDNTQQRVSGTPLMINLMISGRSLYSYATNTRRLTMKKVQPL